MVQKTEQLCQCGLSADRVTEGAFQCFMNSDQQVTFRARIHGTAKANSSQLIAYIEQWVATGTSIAVQRVRIRVEACPVAITTFDDPECAQTTPPTSDNTAAIIGGVIVTLVVIVAVTITVVVIFIMKNKRAKRSLQKVEHTR